MMKRLSLGLGAVALAALPFGMQAQEPGYPQTVIPIAKGPFTFPAGYQTPWDQIDIRVTEKMSPNLFVLHGTQALDQAHPDASGGRAMALFGPDGVLLVDSQNRQVAEQQRQIEQLARELVRLRDAGAADAVAGSRERLALGPQVQLDTGAFEQAQQGTLFIDEIGELPIDMQPKLLRALEERSVKRVGSNQRISIDARIIAATNRDLRTAVNRGAFRADLYYRLNVLPIRVPPLRERLADLESLADALADDIARRSGMPHKSLAVDALELLARQPWPGNIRELRNEIARALALGDGPLVHAAAFSRKLLHGASGTHAEKLNGHALPAAGTLAERLDSIEAMVLRDPELPVVGNANGDVTIVEWFDYNCPYCRKLEPELRQVVQDDGKVRLVLKDWPILGEVSKVASRMALAAKYQDKFLAAHEAMIGVSSRLTEPRIGELLAGAGIDMDRLQRDLSTNANAIDAILARNNDQASAFGFRGTPSFIVGKFRVPGILTMAEFEQVIADARKANMGR